MKKTFIILFSAFVLTSCAGLPTTQVNNYNPTDGIVMHTYNDSMQNAFFKEKPVYTKFCLEPSPDLGESASDSFILSDARESVGLKDGTKAVALGGRANLTLVTRTLMYRACELSMNLNADKDETLKIYDRFLDTIEKIAPHTATQIINNVAQ